MDRSSTSATPGAATAASRQPSTSETSATELIGFGPPTLIEIRARSDAKLPNPFGMIIWGFCTLFALGYGIYNLVVGGVFAGIVLVVGSIVSIYYVGRGLRFRRAVEAVRDVTPPAPLATPPSVAQVLPPSEPTLESPAVVASVVIDEPAARSVGSLAIETVTRPVAVVPTIGPLVPARWLVVRRGDGFTWSYPMPSLPPNQGWWFGWGSFYLRRDVRGFYACVGHPDDRMDLDHVKRLFEEAAVRVGDYTLYVTVTEPTLPN